MASRIVCARASMVATRAGGCTRLRGGFAVNAFLWPRWTRYSVVVTTVPVASAVAVVFMHGYRYPEHEISVAQIAREIGFTQVSTSHETAALMKLVGRGDTTVADAYLSPILKRYVDQVTRRFAYEAAHPNVEIHSLRPF